MKNYTIKSILATVLTFAALTIGQQLWADDWSVTRSDGKFIVTRPSGTGAVTVLYRTVNISAMDGKQYTGSHGVLCFADGETSKVVNIPESRLADVPIRYKYQCAENLYFGFEVTDQDGVILAEMKKSFWMGSTTNNQYFLNGYTSYVNKESITRLSYMNGSTDVSSMVSKSYDIGYTPPSEDVESSGTYQGYALIDDSWDYTRKAATVNPSYLWGLNRAGGSPEWHKLIGNKLYASVYFTEKEKNDGYAYVQILIGDANTAYDTGYDPNGAVNTPVKSIYKACFELKKGSGAYSGYGKWIFPHSSDAHQQSEETSSYSAFPLSSSYLWEQKFRSESYRAGDDNNAFILDPDISALTIRFDCGGEDDDTFGYKDVKVRWALLDATSPTVMKDDITVSPGPHYYGNKATISIPFTEPVTIEFQNRYILHTSWGDFYADYDCSRSNVISFTGYIYASTGTALSINSLEVTNNAGAGYLSNTPNIPIRDLLQNNFGGNVTKTIGVTVDQAYTISYNLAGGSTPLDNLTKYSSSVGPFTLNYPTRHNYSFAGWTGTGLASPTMDVTIPFGATGNRSYTATWIPSGLDLDAATFFGEDRYVTTFYDATYDFKLSAGAKAYTVNKSGDNLIFHQVGVSGRVIPHGTAVVVVANSASVTLTKLNSTTVTAYAGNILVGSDTEDIAKPSGTVYVLGLSGDTLGFYKFNGSTIPAHKAYYVE